MKPIPDFPGYFATAEGAVVDSNRRELKKYATGGGYHNVFLWKVNAQHKTWCLVHRAVASAYLPNPHGKPHVNHIDGDRQNNNVRNLEWATPSENMLHAVSMGTVRRLEKHEWAIITRETFVRIAEMYCTGASLLSIARAFGLSKSGVEHAVSHQRWRSTLPQDMQEKVLVEYSGRRLASYQGKWLRRRAIKLLLAGMSLGDVCDATGMAKPRVYQLTARLGFFRDCRLILYQDDKIHSDSDGERKRGAKTDERHQ